MDKAKPQVNFNSVILLCISALIVFGLNKLDQINTNVIKLHMRVDFIESRIGQIEQTIKNRTP